MASPKEFMEHKKHAWRQKMSDDWTCEHCECELTDDTTCKAHTEENICQSCYDGVALSWNESLYELDKINYAKNEKSQIDEKKKHAQIIYDDIYHDRLHYSCNCCGCDLNLSNLRICKDGLNVSVDGVCFNKKWRDYDKNDPEKDISCAYYYKKIELHF